MGCIKHNNLCYWCWSQGTTTTTTNNSNNNKQQQQQQSIQPQFRMLLVIQNQTTKNYNYNTTLTIPQPQRPQKDCPNGQLTREKFLEVYSSFFPQGEADKFCEHVFRTFDADNSGKIDFKVVGGIKKIMI